MCVAGEDRMAGGGGGHNDARSLIFLKFVASLWHGVPLCRKPARAASLCCPHPPLRHARLPRHVESLGSKCRCAG